MSGRGPLNDSTATPSEHKRTGLAIALALILVVPGMLPGGLAVIVFMFFTRLGMGSDPGSSWIPFVDGVMKVVWVNVLHEAIRGFVAMAAALGITFIAFKQAEQSAVTCAYPGFRRPIIAA